MAKRSNGFNLSAVIREFRKGHRGVSANDALAAVKKANAGQKINDGTFRATFYKLTDGKRKKSVMKRRPGRGPTTAGDATIRAGLNFIRLAGGVENAREQLAGLKNLIETAKTIE
jgi:hypothetical protein